MNSRYQIREGEDKYEYGLRLIQIKIEEKPEDLDWQDIIELCGLDCHRDSLRKAASSTPYSGYAVMQHFRQGPLSECSAEKMSNGAPYGDGMWEKRKAAQRFFDQRREFNKLASAAGRWEHLEDRLIAAAKNLNEASPLQVDKHIPYLYSDNVAVVVFSDWHYGMKTDNIWERYDTAICRERVARLVAQVKARIQLHRCRKLHVVLLGDMAHGAIHVSSRVASDELVCDQLMQVSELLAQAISELSSMVDETVVHATYGNHLRTVQKKAESIHADNMERIIPWWMRQRFCDRPDISFPESEYYEFLYFDVCGYNICAAHGDLDNVRNAGRLLNTLFGRRYGTRIDYVILGDKHHKEEFEELGVESMVARSLCGSDDYANGKRLYSTPGQLMMIFNKDNGCDAYYQIKLREED